MEFQNFMTLSKGNKTYFCKIVEFHPQMSKFKLQLLNRKVNPDFSIFENDIVRIDIINDDSSFHFDSKVLYHDKVNHHVTLEKPHEAEGEHLGVYHSDL